MRTRSFSERYFFGSGSEDLRDYFVAKRKEKSVKRLTGKIALVTGSTQGLGEGIATRFAREGAKVIVNGRSEEKGVKVVENLRSLGADAIFLRADLGDKQQATQWATRGRAFRWTRHPCQQCTGGAGAGAC